MEKCKICGKEFKSPRSVSTHLRHQHKDYTAKAYYDKFLKKNGEGICKECGKETRFYNMTVGYAQFCSNECTLRSDLTKEKTIKTNLERYGTKCTFQAESVKEKIKKTNVERYGVEHPLQNKEIRHKVDTTNLERYGKTTALLLDDSLQRSHSKSAIQKCFDTKKQKNSLFSSKPEENIKMELQCLFPDLKAQYRSDVYPSACDFYIPSLDLYIECNFHWTHGGKFFDKNNKDDMSMLEEWQEKANESKFYRNAIRTWTIRDVRKLETAIKNNLNYIAWFSEEQAHDWINSMSTT